MVWRDRSKFKVTKLTYRDIENRVNEENGTVTLDFSISTGETKNELILKSNHVEADIPELNGYAPTEVKFTGSNATANYSTETRLYVYLLEAVVGEDGTITTGVSRDNTYNVQVIYPIEAYKTLGEDTISIKIPVRTYYEGYNNPSEEFTNPYKSNVASGTIVANYSKPSGEVARFEVIVGEYISNPTWRYLISKQKPIKIYNGISEGEEDTYQVRWEAYTGTSGESTGVVMKETKDGEEQVVDQFIKQEELKKAWKM